MPSRLAAPFTVAVAWYAEPLIDYVRRRHAQLRALGNRNTEIYRLLGAEIRQRPFAAPEVSGVAALVWAARPSLTSGEVAAIIEQSARRTAPGWTPTLGCGVLDAAAAVALALGSAAAPGPGGM